MHFQAASDPPWRQAEHQTAGWMRSLGFADAQVTQKAGDGGVDVVSSRGVAQVKRQATKVSRPDVQRLKGAAHQHSEALFFSWSGYSNQAIGFADTANVALFEVIEGRTLVARSQAAHRLLSAVEDARRLEQQRRASDERAEAERRATDMRLAATRRKVAEDARRERKRKQREFGARLVGGIKAGRERRAAARAARSRPQPPPPPVGPEETARGQAAARAAAQAQADQAARERSERDAAAKANERRQEERAEAAAHAATHNAEREAERETAAQQAAEQKRQRQNAGEYEKQRRQQQRRHEAVVRHQQAVQRYGNAQHAHAIAVGSLIVGSLGFLCPLFVLPVAAFAIAVAARWELSEAHVPASPPTVKAAAVLSTAGIAVSAAFLSIVALGATAGPSTNTSVIPYLWFACALLSPVLLGGACLLVWDRTARRATRP